MPILYVYKKSRQNNIINKAQRLHHFEAWKQDEIRTDCILGDLSLIVGSIYFGFLSRIHPEGSFIQYTQPLRKRVSYICDEQISSFLLSTEVGVKSRHQHRRWYIIIELFIKAKRISSAKTLMIKLQVYTPTNQPYTPTNQPCIGIL